jgi:desampylase
MTIILSRVICDLMIAHAASDPDQEVCGLLLGNGGRVREARACTNVADDPSAHFEIDPTALIAAHKAAREGGYAVMGCYHSHPNGVLLLSERDLACAYDGQIWALIVGAHLGLWVKRNGAMINCG